MEISRHGWTFITDCLNSISLLIVSRVSNMNDNNRLVHNTASMSDLIFHPKCAIGSYKGSVSKLRRSSSKGETNMVAFELSTGALTLLQTGQENVTSTLKNPRTELCSNWYFRLRRRIRCMYILGVRKKTCFWNNQGALSPNTWKHTHMPCKSEGDREKHVFSVDQAHL